MIVSAFGKFFSFYQTCTKILEKVLCSVKAIGASSSLPEVQHKTALDVSSKMPNYWLIFSLDGQSGVLLYCLSIIKKILFLIINSSKTLFAYEAVTILLNQIIQK